MAEPAVQGWPPVLPPLYGQGTGGQQGRASKGGPARGGGGQQGAASRGGGTGKDRAGGGGGRAGKDPHGRGAASTRGGGWPARAGEAFFLGPPTVSWGWLEWRSHGLPTLVC